MVLTNPWRSKPAAKQAHGQEELEAKMSQIESWQFRLPKIVCNLDFIFYDCYLINVVNVKLKYVMHCCSGVV